ncbi:hypothetical protein RRG08_060647 [Elysia crispata]|uniref:Uncharacterized protein n=1 Tax=Elysia crispata TaxID=231223 RepID=A0AAE1AS36_9GAST|nr:hypothetical protein RRG08_060647 [Elysia crispata]
MNVAYKVPFSPGRVWVETLPDCARQEKPFVVFEAQIIELWRPSSRLIQRLTKRNPHEERVTWLQDKVRVTDTQIPGSTCSISDVLFFFHATPPRSFYHYTLIFKLVRYYDCVHRATINQRVAVLHLQARAITLASTSSRGWSSPSVPSIKFNDILFISPLVERGTRCVTTAYSVYTQFACNFLLAHSEH